jgi:hypothetical protein
MATPFDLLELRLQQLIESSSNLFPEDDTTARLANRLALHLQADIEKAAVEGSLSSGHYTIHLHPDSYLRWKQNPSLLERLAVIVQEVALENGARLPSLPVLTLVENNLIHTGEMRLEAVPLTENLVEQTASMPVDKNIDSGKQDSSSIPINAFLIVNTTDTYPLDQVIVNIGRRLDNHLVINDPRVSRNHAQLRAVRGQYMLFDLNSTGGTYVNGQRITQHPIRPGDVISLAGVALIYGEDLPSGQTGSLPQMDENDLQDEETHEL